jgi:tyrosyl-DNA phosphodiesterase 2
MELQTYAPASFDGTLWDRGPRAAGAGGTAGAAPSAAPSAAPEELRIVTWNVWFGAHRFRQRAAALLAELERRRPDVIALQEVTAPLLAAIHAAPWVREGYQVSELDLLGYDVMILARTPIAELATLALPSAMGRRLLVARLTCGLDVATVHLESTAGCAPERAEQLQIILPLLAAREDVVLVGDMNFEPGAPLETAALETAAPAPALTDVWPALRPDDPGYSIDSERNVMRLAASSPSRKRIDRVFARTRRWRPASIELIGTAPIDAAGTFVSDHFGLEAVLRTV